jgi:hypothetical protein
MEFLDKYSPAIFTIIGALLTHVYNIYFQSQNNKHELDKLKEEQRYKISQESFQKMFDKKIETYTALHEKLYKHKINLLEVGFYDHDYNDIEGETYTQVTEANVIKSLLVELSNDFNKNIFYVSKELEEKFLELNLALLLNDKLFDYDIHEGHLDISNITEETYEDNRIFYKKHKLRIDNLISLIEKEIKTIKSNVNFD